MKQKRGWQRLYENLRKIQTGYERIPGFFQKRIVNTVLICMVLYIAVVHLEWRRNPLGLYYGQFIWCYVDLDMPDISFTWQ